MPPAKHYLYRMDHDTGFAPHVSRGVGTLCGCKKTSVERWAEPGSWVIGIGGKGTKQPDKLIYAMHVEETPSYGDFQREHPANAKYLKTRDDAPVLVSRRFWYFGNNAIELPQELEHIILRRQGCKLVSDEDIELLKRLVLRRKKPGKHGEPNNPDPAKKRGPCC